MPRPERCRGRHEGHDGDAAAATTAEPGRHEVPWDGRRPPASGQRRGQPLCQTGTGEPKLLKLIFCIVLATVKTSDLSFPVGRVRRTSLGSGSTVIASILTHGQFLTSAIEFLFLFFTEPPSVGASVSARDGSGGRSHVWNGDGGRRRRRRGHGWHARPVHTAVASEEIPCQAGDLPKNHC